MKEAKPWWLVSFFTRRKKFQQKLRSAHLFSSSFPLTLFDLFLYQLSIPQQTMGLGGSKEVVVGEVSLGVESRKYYCMFLKSSGTSMDRISSLPLPGPPRLLKATLWCSLTLRLAGNLT